MNKMTRIATVAALAAVGVGASASAASAYSIDPPSTHFTGTQVGAHTFSTGGLTVSCTTASFTGNTPASGATINFRTSYSGCTLTASGLTFPATVTVTSDWSVTVTGGSGPWTGNVSVLAPASGNAVTISVPSLGCSIFVNAQTRSGLTATNTTPTGVRISANVPGINYTQNGGCPIPATGTATYIGVVNIPGITITN